MAEGQKAEMTLHYHGTPISPITALYVMRHQLTD